MAINKSMRRVLKALSFDGIEVEASRHLANLKAIDPMKIFYKTIDYKIYNGDHQIRERRWKLISRHCCSFTEADG